MLDMQDCSSVVMDVQQGDALQIGDVMLQVLHKSGRAARIRVTLPRSIKIERLRAHGDDGRSKHGSIQIQQCADGLRMVEAQDALLNG
jgi:hypothetical protein